MRISLITNGTRYALAGESGVSERVHSSAGNFQISPTAERINFSGLGFFYADRVDTGNLVTRITFDTVRSFSTASEAQLWALECEGRIPRVGTLVMDATDGVTTVTRHMLNAIVEPPTRTVNGASVMLSYSVEGGEILPTTEVELFKGIQWTWMLQDWDDLTNDWDTL